MFLKMAPFSIQGNELQLEDVSPAYQILDQFHSGSVEMVCEDGKVVKQDCLTQVQSEAKQLQVGCIFWMLWKEMFAGTSRVV